MKLFKFELKKNWRRNKFLLLFLVVTLSVIALFYRNILLQDDMVNNAVELLVTPHIEHVTGLSGALYEEVRENPEDASLQAKYDNALDMNDYFTDLQRAIENEQWEQVPEVESDFLHTVETHQELGGGILSFQGEELQQRIEKNAILIENQLPYEDDNHSVTVANFVKIAAMVLMSFIGMIMLIFILGDQWSDELEKHTIRTLYTQPLQKWSVLLGKYASMMVGVLFALAVFSIASLTPFAFGEDFGSFAYPQLVIYEDGFSYISTGEYIVRLILLFIGASSLAFSLVILISILFKNRLSTLIITLLVLLGGTALTNQLQALHIPINPFYYFQFMERIEQTESFGSFVIGLILLLVYSIFILFIGYMLEKKGVSFHFEQPNVKPFRQGKTMKSGKRFIAILLFEWRKLWRQGYLKQTVSLLLLLTVVGYIFIFYQTSKLEAEFLQETEERIPNMEQGLIPYYEETIQEEKEIIEELENKESPLTNEETERLARAESSLSNVQQLLDDELMLLERLEEMFIAFQEEDWSTYYDYWIFQNQLHKGEIQLEYRSYQLSKSFFTYEASIVEKEIMKARDLRPVLPSEYTHTIHETHANRFEEIEWARETQKIESTGLFFLYTFFDLYIYFVPLALFVFVFASGFSGEKGKKRTLHFLETQPISRKKIFTGKSTVSALLTLGVASGLLLVMTLLGTVGNRFGDWLFPVLHYDAPELVESANYSGMTSSEGGFHFITMGSYLVQVILLFLAVLLFFIVLSIFISVFTENIMNTFVITGFLAVSGYFLSTIEAVSSVAHFLPFTYINASKIANGELATVLNNSSVHTWSGIVALLVSSIILFMIGLFVFGKSNRKKGNTSASAL